VTSSPISHRTAVGIDLGGTKIAAGLVRDDGTVLARAGVPTPAREGAAAILDAVARLVGLVLPDGVDAPGSPGSPDVLVGVGIGSAGVIDSGRGTVVSATDALTGWAGTDLTGGISARLAATGSPAAHLPVLADNDVHAHALGEHWLGACAGTRTALVVAAGTGVGATLLLDGSPQHGARHVAGHLGHLPVAEAAGLPCTCSRTGHLEAVGSGPALHALYLRLGGDPAHTTARAVCEVAGDDTVARHAVVVAATALGRTVGGVANMLDPEVVVVSGGLAGAGALWWDTMSAALASELMPPLVGLPVVPAVLGGDAAVLGAARLALAAHDRTPGGATALPHDPEVGLDLVTAVPSAPSAPRRNS